MSQTSTQIDRYINEIACAALHATYEGVESSQVNKLIEYLETTDTLTLAVYLSRQVARGYWGGRREDIRTEKKGSLSASKLISIISSITRDIKDEGKRKEVLRKILGYFKWFYEISNSLLKGETQKSLRSKCEGKIPEEFWRDLISEALKS